LLLFLLLSLFIFPLSPPASTPLFDLSPAPPDPPSLLPPFFLLLLFLRLLLLLHLVLVFLLLILLFLLFLIQFLRLILLLFLFLKLLMFYFLLVLLPAGWPCSGDLPFIFTHSPDNEDHQAWENRPHNSSLILGSPQCACALPETVKRPQTS